MACLFVGLRAFLCSFARAHLCLLFVVVFICLFVCLRVSVLCARSCDGLVECACVRLFICLLGCAFMHVLV